MLFPPPVAPTVLSILLMGCFKSIPSNVSSSNNRLMGADTKQNPDIDKCVLDPMLLCCPFAQDILSCDT